MTTTRRGVRGAAVGLLAAMALAVAGLQRTARGARTADARHRRRRRSTPDKGAAPVPVVAPTWPLTGVARRAGRARRRWP